MIKTPSFRAALLLASLFTVTHALAAGSAASMASDSASSAASSTSDSVNNASASSSKATGVAAGDYRVIDIAPVADRDDTVRIRLAAVATAAAQQPFEIRLPGKAARDAGLITGSNVTLTPRPYGVELADTASRVPFFLVLHDTWHRDLTTRALSL